MNPLKYGFFAWQFFSHKALRYIAFFPLVVAYASNLALIGRGGVYLAAFSAQTILYLLALAGWFAGKANREGGFLYTPFYFCLLNVASADAFVKMLQGKRQVIWNHNGRGKATLDAFYKKLGKKGCEKIEAVASDGARGFLSSTKKHLKHAVIVLDHFHVKKYLNDAVDTVRKEELRKARQQEQEELSEVLHCNKRFILMQNTVSDKKRDLLERLSSLNERVYKAMLLKEQFLTIYQAGERKAAYANLRQWIVAAVKSGMPSFVELGYKFFRKRHYVLNYFICKITAAISEGINNKIKRLKRMAYGYRDVKYFLLKIHQHCGLLSPRLST